jgi:hypothetical protein
MLRKAVALCFGQLLKQLMLQERQDNGVSIWKRLVIEYTLEDRLNFNIKQGSDGFLINQIMKQFNDFDPKFITIQSVQIIPIYDASPGHFVFAGRYGSKHGASGSYYISTNYKTGSTSSEYHSDSGD